MGAEMEQVDVFILILRELYHGGKAARRELVERILRTFVVLSCFPVRAWRNWQTRRF